MSDQFYMADPAMEAARAEIVEVLKKYDLMGAVMICGQKRSGFFHEVSPSWSCAKVSKTIGGFMGLLHVHKFIGQNLSALLTMISGKFEIKHMASDQRLQQGREADDEV